MNNLLFLPLPFLSTVAAVASPSEPSTYGGGGFSTGQFEKQLFHKFSAFREGGNSQSNPFSDSSFFNDAFGPSPPFPKTAQAPVHLPAPSYPKTPSFKLPKAPIYSETHSYTPPVFSHPEAASYPKAPNYPKAPSYPTKPSYPPAPSYHKTASLASYHAKPSYPPTPSNHYGMVIHPSPAYHPPDNYEKASNCTTEPVISPAEACIPTLDTACEDVRLSLKTVSEVEQCYTVTRTVCAASAKEVDLEICKYASEDKTETTSAKGVEVSFKKDCSTQMATLCDTIYYGHPSSYNKKDGYGKPDQHLNCKTVSQETCTNVPVVTQTEPSVEVTYPNLIKACVNKPISLPIISCEDVKEEKCIKVPEVQEASEATKKCLTKIGTPKCSSTPLDLVKQGCSTIVQTTKYGYEK